MNDKEFKKVFDSLVKLSEDVLITKAKEYASDQDRLHNFKKAAHFQGITAEQALWGFATKHLVSISDMVASGKEYPQDKWDEKLGDALNYLILLQAVVTDRANDSTNNSVVNPEDVPYSTGIAVNKLNVPSGF